MNHIDLSELQRFRERFAIATAGSVNATFYSDQENSTPIRFDLAELADELLSLGHEAIEDDYRAVLAGMRLESGTDQHGAALEWARNLLNRAQAQFCVRMFQGRSPQ